MKKPFVFFSLLAILSGLMIIPACAGSYQSIYSGWAKSGETMSAGGFFINVNVSDTGMVRLGISSPDHLSTNLLVGKGDSYYYYDTLRVYIADVDTAGGRALIDVSKPVTSSEESASGTSLSCDVPGQYALGGDTVTFPIAIKNNNEEDKTYTLSSTCAAGWETGLKFGDKDVYRLFVPQGQSKTVTLEVKTTAVSIGEKKVTVKVDDISIDLYVYITSSNQTMELSAKVSSKIVSIGDKAQYELQVSNKQASEASYQLSVDGLPESWYYRFKEAAASTEEMAVVVVPGNTVKTLLLEVVPPYSVSEGTYGFTAKAVSTDGVSSKAAMNLTLKSGVDMSVTSSKLAYDTKPGGSFNIDVYVSNGGTGGSLTNVGLEIEAPDGWVVTSSPEKVNSIKSGDSQKFTVGVQAPGNIAASDYEVSLKVKSDQSVEEKTYRVTIYTESYIPYIGAGIILLVVAGLVLMYKKYGRR